MYPAFSPAEMDRRRRLLEELLAEADAAHLLVYEANRAGSAVQWISGWPTTREAVLVLTPGSPDVLLIQFYNHVPNARRLASRAEVRWGGSSTTASLVAELEARRVASARVGYIGSLPHKIYQALSEVCGELVDLSGRYTELRLIKSEEELDWLRKGAELSDRAVKALLDHAAPGMNEFELVALVEDAYLSAGATTHIHYLGSTSMAEPDRCVPAQYPSARRLAPGDVLMCELSASYWGYPGQVLRTFSVATEPSALYRRLHEVAEAAFAAIVACLRDGTEPEEVIEAASVIEEAGFTIYDDLVHGFGGGYLPPVLGSRSRPAGRLPDLVFRAGMTVVVQPNVITPDERAGVQTGELVHITDSGVERLHRAPAGFLRIG